MEGEYYRTWFYFSVTGVPQGELLTFTFKNLSNQVSFKQNDLKDFLCLSVTSILIVFKLQYFNLCNRQNFTIRAWSPSIALSQTIKRSGAESWLKLRPISMRMINLHSNSAICFRILIRLRPTSLSLSRFPTRIRSSLQNRSNRNSRISPIPTSIGKFCTTLWRVDLWSSWRFHRVTTSQMNTKRYPSMERVFSH